MEIKKPECNIELELEAEKLARKMRNKEAVSRQYMKNYCCSFVDDDDFENKQFDRYVAKVEAFLKKELTIMNPSHDQIDDLSNYLLFMLATYYKDCDPHDDTNTSGSLFHLMNRHCVKPEFKLWDELGRRSNTNNEGDADEQPNGVQNNHQNSNVKVRSNSLTYEFRAACKEFIRKRSAGNDSINRSTYFATLPQTPEDAVEIIKDVLNRTAIDFERNTRSSVFESMVQIRNDDKMIELTNKLENANLELSERNEKIEELENTLKLLRDKCERNEAYNAELISTANDYVLALQRENQKLKNKYETLLQKYKDLTRYSCNTSEIEGTGECADLVLPKLDTTKRYLFVIGEYITFQSQLSNAFPNSLFATKVQSMSQMDIECVVAITSCIDHSLYYGMKSQCKSQNIPFVHCEHSNVELIKQLLLNTLY